MTVLTWVGFPDLEWSRAFCLALLPPCAFCLAVRSVPLCPFLLIPVCFLRRPLCPHMPPCLLPGLLCVFVRNPQHTRKLSGRFFVAFELHAASLSLTSSPPPFCCCRLQVLSSRDPPPQGPWTSCVGHEHHRLSELQRWRVQSDWV